ncbi:MAG: chemotaxis response regulator protein-glutamate methylesterase [Rhizomicrobium sp.]
MTNPAAKIKVLIVDGSAAVRRTLSDLLSEDPHIEVLGIAADPFAAARRIRSCVPDVIILDTATPRMDGLTFLHKLMAQHPIPVVMCMPPEEEDGDIMMRAKAAGAVGIIFKPRTGAVDSLTEARSKICEAVHQAASVHMMGSRREPRKSELSSIVVTEKLTADAMLPATTGATISVTTEPLVCIGASTGGTESLHQVLAALTISCPGIVIVQHMPEHFTASFAKRLDSLCEISVKEAESGDIVAHGRAFIAPGGRHVILERCGNQYTLQVRDGPPVSRHRPSVDVLFRSAAQVAGPNAIGIIMTGMGDDGARGLLEMKQAGAYTVAQDQATSVVFGMPKEAIRWGAVDRVVPLQRISAEIMNAVRS